MNRSIDLNADLAEGDGLTASTDDLALLELITSANIACGFHAGNPALMRAICRVAQDRGVNIGAHVSYHDRESFGRRDRDIPADELSATVLYQLGALDAFGDVAYLKPHGALYNRVVRDEAQATAVVTAVLRYNPTLLLMCLPNSQLLKLAESAGLGVIPEGFADRAYTEDGQLRPRSQPDAVITDAADAARQAVTLASSGKVRSLCVHGDNPNALAIARAVRAALEDAGFTIGAGQ